MNKDDCIRILKNATANHLSFLSDNGYRYKLSNKDGRYDKEVLAHKKEINEIKEALNYLEINLK